MPVFHDVLFPEDISYGSSGGPGFNTTVIELASGHEKRNINWSEQKAKYDVSHGIKTRDQMEDLLEFFYARRARAFGFRFKDWMDYQIFTQVLAVGDGVKTTFPFFKRYEPDTAYFFDRPLSKLVPDTVDLGATLDDIDVTFTWATASSGTMSYDYINDVLAVVHVSIGFTLDHNTGILTFATPLPLNLTLIILAAEFHVPVRFDIDDVTITHDDWETMSWPSIPLVELKPDEAE